MEELEEAQMNLQAMLTMRHVTPFRDRAQELLQALSETSDTLGRVRVCVCVCVWVCVHDCVFVCDCARMWSYVLCVCECVSVLDCVSVYVYVYGDLCS